MSNASSICEHFQIDLSCLADGELDERAAGRVMIHLDGCDTCSDFFQDVRQQVKAHRDMLDPDRLFARMAILTGAGPDLEVEGIDLVNRLATILYQLGKAYVLTAIDDSFRNRIFEAAVSVEPTRRHGRGFVDGVMMGDDDRLAGPAQNVDWTHARSLLNGRLESLADPLEKGRRLLEEAIAADPSHEEARLYLAFLSGHQGKKLIAAEQYRDIFQTALDTNNRGHAVIQLGRLYSTEGEYRKAVACFRWVTMSGLADQDDRFFVVRFNLGMMYAHLGKQERSLDAFRELLDRHPQQVAEVGELFAKSPKLRDAIDSQPGFAEALVSRCPELFAAGSVDPEELGK